VIRGEYLPGEAFRAWHLFTQPEITWRFERYARASMVAGKHPERSTRRPTQRGACLIFARQAVSAFQVFA